MGKNFASPIEEWLSQIAKNMKALLCRYIAKTFVRDELDLDILEELLSLGGLVIQYCIRSEKAYSQLHEIQEALISVEYDVFNQKYNDRDVQGRDKMRELIDSDANKVTKVFSTLM